MEKSRLISYLLFAGGLVLLVIAWCIDSPVWSDLVAAASIGALLITLKSASRA
ncbi:MAG: hypothetical protein ACKOQY_01080 [Bacteroidota bacterium]